MFHYIDDNCTVNNPKKAIVKEKPGQYANVEVDEFALWKVSDSSPISLFYAHNFPKGIQWNEVRKHPFFNDGR